LGFRQAEPARFYLYLQPGSDTDEELRPAEPLVYIARNGVLTMREKQATYVPLVKQATVLDGRWHELSLRRAKGSWEISVDGGPAGRVSGLFTGSEPPRYLQVGPASR
jgi:hypothetical protein